MMGRNERDTCREFVVPRLVESGCEDSFRTEYVVRSDLATNTTLGGDGRVDYLLEIMPGLPIGVVEAKREYSRPGQVSSRPSSTPSPSTSRPRSPRTVTRSSSVTCRQDRAAPGLFPDPA